jgi:hypothetical protein
MVPLNREGGPKFAFQLDWDDSLLVCFDRVVQIVDLHGRPVAKKTDADGSVSSSSSNLVPKIVFDFRIANIVCLTDSVLAFHEHGFQGRALSSGGVTQEITDPSRVFRVLGVER